MTPYCYAANTPINAIDPDGDVVVFINGFSYGGEGGTRKYWQKTETQTRSVRYTDGFGRSLWSGNEKQEVVTSDFAKSFCEKFGEDVNKAKFFDGAPLDFPYPLFRMGVGYVKGKLNVEEIIKGLARTGGVITEPLIMATHSMGGIYGRGFLDAVIEFVKNNPAECKGLSISVYDFDPYQAKYMEEVYGVSITQIIHDGTVADQKVQGTEEDGGSVKYIDDTKNSNSHSIQSFLRSYDKLKSGTYVWNGKTWVKK